MAKYKDTAGNIIEVGNPALNPDLVAGKTLVPDSTSITSGAPAPVAAAPKPAPSSIDASIADNQARAKALGITIPGIGDRPSPVVSSSTVRNDLTERGADPNTANFSTEEAYRRFVEQVQPKTAAPAASSLVDTYTGLTTKYGIDKLQSDLSALDDESAAIDAELRTFKAKESDRQSAGFVRGRISEAERTVLERQSYLTQQKNSLVGRINSANSTISTIMTLTGQDYQNARDVYEFEYNKNMATLQAFQKTQTEAKTEAEKVANETRDDARAKLTTIYNQLSTGGASVDSLTASQQATIQQLELQAGFPTGFFESIQRANPKSDIISTTTREADGRKYADVVTRGADGALSVETIPLGASSGKEDNNKNVVDVPTFEEYLKSAEQVAMMSFGPSAQKELKTQYDAAYGQYQGDNVPQGFTPTELKKLEQANLLNASRKEQLDFLYPPKKDSTTTSETMTDEELMAFLTGK